MHLSSLDGIRDSSHLAEISFFQLRFATRDERAVLKSPMRNACVALGAHSLYVILFCASTLNPNFSMPLKMVSPFSSPNRHNTYSAELLQTSFGLVDSGYPVLCFAVARAQGIFERAEPWI
jgi:hypothetical protein